VRIVYGFLVLVAVLRVMLLFLRPRTSRRFPDRRRQRIANWVDRLGDLLFLVTAFWVVRYGEGASWKMGLLWVAGLLTSLFIVGSAHNVARRAGRRSAPPPAARARTRPPARPPTRPPSGPPTRSPTRPPTRPPTGRPSRPRPRPQG
jgi:hypothetical protein